MLLRDCLRPKSLSEVGIEYRSLKCVLTLIGSKRTSDVEESADPKPVKKARKAKPYVPPLRSGAYALIVALATLDEDASTGMTKADTIDRAQPHCDNSFTAPSDPTKFYTAWNSMKTLVDKDFVYEHGRPLRRYMLTEDGWEVAKRMQAAVSGQIGESISEERPSRTLSAPEASKDGSHQNEAAMLQRRTASDQDTSVKIKPKRRPMAELLSSSPPRSPTTGVSKERENAEEHPAESTRDSAITTLPTFAPIRLPAGSFTVHLLLDSREIRTKTDRDYISDELSKRGVVPITRSLPLADALWIARLHSSAPPSLLSDIDSASSTVDIVLDYAVERKRLDDLISSIKDGRFHEQKFRLRKSGLRHITYLIEDFSLSAEKSDKYGDAVSSAIANTQVVNGYFVKRTTKLDDTIRYLARMTQLMKAKYEQKELLVIPSEVLDPQTYLPLLAHLRRTNASQDHYITYTAFSSLVSKSSTLSLRDVYLKMLMCTRGVTGEKALEIQKRWKTPRELVEALKERDEDDENDGDPKGKGKEGQGKGKRGGTGNAKQTMVCEQLGGPMVVPRKKVARGLSGKIAEVWG